MSGIQISGLLANSTFDWKSIVDQLIAADSIPITTLTAQKTTNSDQITALQAIQTSMSDLQDSVQAIRTGNLFSSRSVTSDTTGTTWQSNSSSGAAIGSYKFDVQTLATNAETNGAGDIGVGLSTTSDVSGLTLANLNLGNAITPGTFTVDGKPVTIALTDSLAGVFSKISTATGGDVTASYDPTSDGITLHSASGELVLGASNDSSNFITAMKLANNGTPTTSSFSALGTVKLNSPLASSGLRGAITAVDGSGNGTFSVNGVAINYNVNTDSLSTVLSRINQSSAGVTASYDSANDRVVVANQNTGDVGIGLNESGNGLLGALGLTTGATFARGKNAQFTINDGPMITSNSNTLDSTTTGISGLSVTVNTVSTQTVTVASDTSSMQSAIQDFLDKFNATQDLISADTTITTSAGTATPAVLSSNSEVEGWASKLQSLAFDAVPGLTGSVSRLDDLGIDFDSTTGHLIVKDQTKLADALTNNPTDVQAFFLSGSSGLVPKIYNYLMTTMGSDTAQQSSLGSASADVDTQISTLQAKLDDERTQLTNSFIAMLDAQSTAQTQSTYLTQAYSSNNGNNNSCWVARVVYGARNPRWIVFRHWLLHRAPRWFRALYLRHGERFAGWLADKPGVQSVIRRWMDARIAGLASVLPFS